ncbi:MAG TPA: methyl-accepting chemotaxis protein [Ignavibacteriales bacterium]|nr:methyl-accepting chemotaxis protein [Ignavibacteriales bacterium]
METIKLKTELDEVVKQIKYLNDISENQFIKLGELLQQTSSNIKNLIIDLEELKNNYENHNYPELLNKLNNSFNVIIDFFTNLNNSSNEDLNNITFITQEVKKSSELLTKFKAIVKSLKMLGIATRIESSRLTDESGGFNALADNVESLSSYIEQKSINIVEKTKDIVIILATSYDIIDKVVKNNLMFINDIIDKQEFSNDEINNKITSDKETYNSIFQKFDELKKNANNIVVGIQFQDITKQRLDHILQAIYDINHQIDNNKIDYNNLYHILELQSHHLNDINKTLQEAVNNIFNSVNSIFDIFTDFQDLLNSLLIDKDTKEDYVLKIENIITLAKDSLNKGLNEETELTSVIENVISNINELTKFIKQIEDTGEEIELIALNARVKAARVGSNGAALGVIAEEVQNLSVDARNQIKIISEILLKVNQTTDKLKEIVNENTISKNNEEVNFIFDQLQSILDDIKKIRNDLNFNISKNLQFVENIIYLIKNEVLKFNAHRNFDDTIKKIILRLNDLLLKLQPSVTEKNIEIIDKHQSNYTMHHERKVHNNYLNKNFNEDLGSNVELF